MKDHPDIHFVNQKAKGFKSTVVDLMKNDIPYNVQFVDDIVFINPFTLLCPEFEAFKTDPETTCLSLRMHPGISYCYMLDQQTPPPENISSGKWAWTGLQGDWKYPYSTDGHIFRNEDILPCILNENYQHPNGLEDKMTGAVVQRPYVRCFPKAKLINIPSNRVGQNVSNRHGDISAELLNSNYLKGMKIDIRPFFGVDKNAVHCEMEYTWIQP